MNDDSNLNKSKDVDSSKEKDNQQETLTVHNPFNPADTKQISQEDIENEQKYKEALTERD